MKIQSSQGHCETIVTLEAFSASELRTSHSSAEKLQYFSVVEENTQNFRFFKDFFLSSRLHSKFVVKIFTQKKSVLGGFHDKKLDAILEKIHFEG